MRFLFCNRDYVHFGINSASCWASKGTCNCTADWSSWSRLVWSVTSTTANVRPYGDLIDVYCLLMRLRES
jgi:hypothetical protein